MAQRPRPSIAIHVPFLLVMIVVVIAIVRISQYHWRQGGTLIGAAMVLAAALRAILPSDRAGLIAVRGRAVDTLLYGGLGLVIVFIALSIEGGPLDT
nr:DUF3017 domain-containing protein [Herbihabitans rhizosphaerae]